MFVRYNGNPCGINTIDCVIRAISIATGMRWRKVYAALCVFGYDKCTWGNVNAVWESYLLYLGFYRRDVTTGTNYNVRDFSIDHPHGTYILGTGTHAVAVINSDWIDSWDSGNEKPLYYFAKE